MTDGSQTVYLVHVSEFDDHGGAVYSTEGAAQEARDWFDEHGHGAAIVHEVPLNEGFTPPTSFHANYLAWGYGNG